MLIDEDLVELAFWKFNARRKETGDEREAFKQQLRAAIQEHQEGLRQLLMEAETYVRAYKCQCNAIKGIPGAARLLRKMANYTTVRQA